MVLRNAKHCPVCVFRNYGDNFVALDSKWEYLLQSHCIPLSCFSNTSKLPCSHKKEGIGIRAVADVQKAAQPPWPVWPWAIMDFLQSCREGCGQARVYAPAVQCEQWHRKAAGLLPEGPTKAARSSPCNANRMTVAAGGSLAVQPPPLPCSPSPSGTGTASVWRGRSPGEVTAKRLGGAGCLQSSALTPAWLWDGTSSISGHLLTLHFRCLWCLASGQSGQDSSQREAPTQLPTKPPFSVSEWGDWREPGEEQREGGAEPSVRGKAHGEVGISSVSISPSKDPSCSPCAWGMTVLGQRETGKREERELEKSRATERGRWWRGQRNQDGGAWKNVTTACRENEIQWDAQICWK